MVIYKSEYEYIQTGTSLKEKIGKIDAIINALYDTAVKSATNDNITEYSLDDGQTKIHTVYRGTDAVLKSISSLEKVRDMYVIKYNKLNTGNVIRLMDSKNFTRNQNGARF